MRTLAISSALFLAFAGFAVADSYTGLLIDANCPSEQKSAPKCDPTPATTSFALIISGDQLKTLRFDGAGNAKAAAAMKDNNGGSKRPAPPGSSARSVIVTVSGAIQGDEIKVDSLRVD